MAKAISMTRNVGMFERRGSVPFALRGSGGAYEAHHSGARSQASGGSGSLLGVRFCLFGGHGRRQGTGGCTRA